MNMIFKTELEIEPKIVYRQGLKVTSCSFVTINTTNEDLHDALVAAVLAVEESRKG